MAETIEFVLSHRGRHEPMPLSKVTHFFKQQLEKNGCSSAVHPTRLRDDIQKVVPGLLSIEKPNKRSILVFEEELGHIVAMSETMSSSLTHAARVLREDILKIKNTFTGYFTKSAEEDSVPASLVNFITSVIDGDTDGFDTMISKIAKSISQTIAFNCAQRRRGSEKGVVRHVRER
jgi:hypothetical protein